MSPQENTVALLKNFDMLTIANLLVLRVFIGFFLIILTANVIGREYQLGTVRILLARGIGRVQLLLAKVSAVVIVALFTLLIALLIQMNTM
jgi:ABC-2 type transport system permease protein